MNYWRMPVKSVFSLRKAIDYLFSIYEFHVEFADDVDCDSKL